MIEILNGQPCGEDVCPSPQDGENCIENPPAPHLKVWSLTYRIKGAANYAGMAVVVAEDVRGAIRAFRTESAHNGNQQGIIIKDVVQITFVDIHDKKLVMENYIQVFE